MLGCIRNSFTEEFQVWLWSNEIGLQSMQWDCFFFMDAERQTAVSGEKEMGSGLKLYSEHVLIIYFILFYYFWPGIGSVYKQMVLWKKSSMLRRLKAACHDSLSKPLAEKEMLV